MYSIFEDTLDNISDMAKCIEFEQNEKLKLKELLLISLLKQSLNLKLKRGVIDGDILKYVPNEHKH